MAMLKRARGLPVPGPRFGSKGVTLQSMGTPRPTYDGQVSAEKRVLAAAMHLKDQPFGYRAKVRFQEHALVVSRDMLPGYGDSAHRYKPEECISSSLAGPGTLQDDEDNTSLT